MSARRPIFAAATASQLAMMLAVGCRVATPDSGVGQQSGPTTNLVVSGERQLPILLQPVDRPVVQGRLPLVYLVEAPGRLKVMDIRAGTVLGVFDVKPGQIVRVGTTGVTVGRETPIRKNLTSELYAISVVPPQTTIESAQELTNTPAPKPAQQPQAIDITPSPAID